VRITLAELQVKDMSRKAVAATSRPSNPLFARLQVRISRELHDVIKRAAVMQGRTVTEFVVHALQSAAPQAISKSDQERLSLADPEAFAKALISPAKPNAALRRAFARANKLLGT
jgi:uncharacterized protein (DUF1778 family)